MAIRDRRGETTPVPGAVLGRRLSVTSAAQRTGFHGTNGHHGSEPGSEAARPLSTQGLSDERIAEARRVWSRAYGRVISEDEAIAILMNVRRLAEVLWHAEEAKCKP